MEPRWLSRRIVDWLHAEMIAEHGGVGGVREGGDPLIESALARPRNRLAYVPDSDLADLAAAYLFGFVKNHGYLDGNKRVALASAATFLHLNGRRLAATEAEAYDLVMRTADSRTSEDAVADWFREHSIDSTQRTP